MKTESKFKIIAYCFITYGLIIMIGTIFDILLELNSPVWIQFLQAFALFLIAIAAYLASKKVWWFVVLSSLYVLSGELLGFTYIMPESFSVPAIFYPSLLLMFIPLILILTIPKKDDHN